MRRSSAYDSWGTIENVTLHYSMLGLFENTQAIPLGHRAVGLRAPTARDCAA
ncbi:MAG: hypothetical protein ACJ740_05050 [Gaiellales bacterium]